MTDPIQRLILELARLPGIGERSAARLAYYIIKVSQDAGQGSLARELAGALTDAVDRVRLCERCQNLSAEPRCSLCEDPRREATTICVVESVADLRALESSGAFRGSYHVLHGSIAPLDGVGPDELKIRELVTRLEEEDVGEVILATNADVEGDATALYLARLLGPSGVRLTRLASGIPLGGELEFVDQGTLGRALAERRELR